MGPKNDKKFENGPQFRDQWTWKLGYSPNSGKQNFPFCLFFEIVIFFLDFLENFGDFLGPGCGHGRVAQPGAQRKKTKKI